MQVVVAVVPVLAEHQAQVDQVVVAQVRQMQQTQAPAQIILVVVAVEAAVAPHLALRLTAVTVDQES
jgi:hypothetical protein